MGAAHFAAGTRGVPLRRGGGLMVTKGHWSKGGGTLLPAAAWACLRLAVITVGLLMAFPLAAQEVQPPPEQAPGSSSSPGFMDALGRWFGESKAALDSHLKTTQDALGKVGTHATGAVKEASGAAQQATEAIVGLPGARVVTGRQLCPEAPNGAPDCVAAADTLCRSQGFKSGKGVEVSSGEQCSTKIWLTRRNRRDGPCMTETYVKRAVCQ
jgi:hypothetical protein